MFRAEYQVPALSGVYDDNDELVYDGAHDGLRGLGQLALERKQQAAALARDVPVRQLPESPPQGPPVALIVGGVVAAVVVAMLVSKKKGR